MMVKRRACWCLIGFFCFTNFAATVGDLRVVQAVKNSDRAALRVLLHQGADVNASEIDGTTALHWAVSRDDVQTVELLLSAGANAKAISRYGVNPLLIACNRASAPVVAMLLKAGADPNSALPEGETALMTAARAGKADVIKLLHAAGANINAKESWHGQTALMWAAAENHPAAIATLKELGADLTARSDGGFTPLLFAVREGRIEAVETLLELGANINDTVQPQKAPTTPARPANSAQAGASGTSASRITFNGAPVNPAGPEGTSALVLAITNAHFELAKYLVDHGADPNASAQGWTPLHQLEYTRRPNHAKGLPPPEPTGNVDSLELARALLAKGANPNARQTREINDGQRNNLYRVGATPFLLAAKHADVPMMRLLAQHGADPLLTTEGGATALAVAAGVGLWNPTESAGTNEEAFEAVKLAYELGCTDVNAADDRGYAPLHGAALRGSNEIVQFLAGKGAKLDLETKAEGWTPLRIADGVYYANTVKRMPETATLLRQLMKARGLPVPDFEFDVDYGKAARQPKP